MARRSTHIDPSIRKLIERAPVAQIDELLQFSGGDASPNFVETVRGVVDDRSNRAEVIEAFAEFTRDELKPLEIRCRRILGLAEDKGATSLDTIARQRLYNEDYLEFSTQPDEIARSIWVYLQFERAFIDAESFHFARRYRENEKLYDAFEVDLMNADVQFAASVDEDAVSVELTKTLELTAPCVVTALDLPATKTHPASVMLVVRHGGPLSSVYDHRDDGRENIIYYRPRNEAILIYTPGERRIEICGETRPVRQKIANSFAAEVLDQDLSRKPLTWRRYDLSRFRKSLTLPTPTVDGFDITETRVVEAEIRLGHWSRKLSLAVSIGDDIEQIADTYLKSNNLFRTAGAFSRIRIAVRYSVDGDIRRRSLPIRISGANSCTVPGLKDPLERSLGYELLKAWGVLTAFREIPEEELKRMFPRLVALFDAPDDEVSGAHLAELGLDPERLIQGGMLEQRRRQEIMLIDDDDTSGEGEFDPSRTPGHVALKGPFGEDAGVWPTDDLRLYKVNQDWLRETIGKLLKPILSRSGAGVLDENIIELGAVEIDGQDVPVYHARRLGDPKGLRSLDIILRARNEAGAGIVLSFGGSLPLCLGPNVVIDLLSVLADGGSEAAISSYAVHSAFRNGRSLALGGTAVAIQKSSRDSATLHLPGTPPLSLIGEKQILIFERLVKAHRDGAPNVKSGRLLEGMGAKSVQNAFTQAMWRSINGIYIRQSETVGYWRLSI